LRECAAEALSAKRKWCLVKFPKGATLPKFARWETQPVP